MEGSSRRAAGDKGPSQLLAALSHCNETAWVQHLLPKLRKSKSLSSVALSCKQLRALCHGNAEVLRFSRQKLLLQHQQNLLQHLPARFAACSTV
jgi:hypothetical protein